MELKSLFTLIITVGVLFSCSSKDNNIKREFYKNGRIKFIKRYNDSNILDGQSQWFFANGNLEQIVIFKKGKENGNAYYFYENGALKNFRYWREGLMVGYVCDYFNNNYGTIKSVLLFNNLGQLIYKKNFDTLGRFISEEGKKPSAITK